MIWLFSFHSDQMKPMVINFTLPLNFLPNRWNLIQLHLKSVVKQVFQQKNDTKHISITGFRKDKASQH